MAARPTNGPPGGRKMFVNTLLWCWVLVSKERAEKLLLEGTMAACNENKSKLVEWTACWPGRVRMINLVGNIPSNLGYICRLLQQS